jgi:type I restriction enzyme S subunit
LLSVLRSTNFTDSGNLDLTDVAKRGFSANNASQILVRPNDILLERSGGGPDRPVGRVVNIPSEMPNTGFANFIQCLRPNQAEVHPEFLRWALFQLHRCGQVARIQHQTTQMRNLDLRDYHRVRLPYPEPAEQARIAAVLTAADAHIRALDQQIYRAERVKKAMLERAVTEGLNGATEKHSVLRYGHVFEVSKRWGLIELRTLKPHIQYGTNEPSNDRGAGVPVIAIPQVLASRFTNTDLPHAVVSDAEKDALSLQPFDVLLVRTNGNPSYIGRSTVITDVALATTTVFASYLIRVRVDRNTLRGTFLNYVLRSSFGRRQSNSLANTSAGNFNLGARALGRFLIPLPTPEEQDAIVEALDAADDLILRLQEQLRAAQRAKQSLLQNLLTGRIRLKA